MKKLCRDFHIERWPYRKLQVSQTKGVMHRQHLLLVTYDRDFLTCRAGLWVLSERKSRFFVHSEQVVPAFEEIFASVPNDDASPLPAPLTHTTLRSLQSLDHLIASVEDGASLDPAAAGELIRCAQHLVLCELCERMGYEQGTLALPSSFSFALGLQEAA